MIRLPFRAILFATKVDKHNKKEVKIVFKDIKVSFTIENMDEYKELLRKAAFHSEQLAMVMKQIKNFNFKAELKS
jgi:hypothetical protein